MKLCPRQPEPSSIPSQYITHKKLLRKNSDGTSKPEMVQSIDLADRQKNKKSHFFLTLKKSLKLCKKILFSLRSTASTLRSWGTTSAVRCHNRATFPKELRSHRAISTLNFHSPNQTRQCRNTQLPASDKPALFLAIRQRRSIFCRRNGRTGHRRHPNLWVL